MIKLLTGNELLTGDVVWWDGKGWSLHLGEAVDVTADGAALLAQVQAEERINDAALVDAQPGPPPRPRTARERIRGLGPSVRPDLARV